MKLSTTSNGDQIKKELEKTAKALPDLNEKALQVGTQSLLGVSVGFLKQLIYQRAIPSATRKRGKFKGQTVPLWRRKGQNGGLLGTETAWVSEDGKQGIVGTKPNTAPTKAIKNWPGGYAQKVHDAKPWRDKTVSSGMPTALEKMRAVIGEGIGAK